MNELPIKKVSDEVYIATDSVVRFDYRAIEFIKEKAILSPRGRSRICAHKNASDNLHEMLIAIKSDSYIRPHRHRNKVESFHLIEGRADIVILNEEGNIEDVVKLGTEYFFYYRLNTPHYHTLVIHSPLFVIHEVTNGPFDPNASDYAKFSPLDDDKDHAFKYIENLKLRLTEKL